MTYQQGIATSTVPLDDLPNGLWQVTTGNVATYLGLPEVAHGTLTLERWGSGNGVVTFHTRTDPVRVWAASWSGTTRGPWRRLTPPGPESAPPDYTARHLHVRERHEARISAPIDVGTATPVAFVWDDYPEQMRDKGVIEWAEEYEVPITFAVCSRTLTPERRDHLGGNNISWSEIDGWVQDGWVELANHGATHYSTRTPAQLHDEIVTGLDELQAHSPSKEITTWVMPTNTWDGFNSGDTPDAWASLAGQLILGHHAYATGKAPVLPDRTQPMTGRAVQGQDRKWVEASELVAATRQGIVTGLYGTGRGVILSAHASLIDATGRWSSTDVEEFFAWLHDEEVAGRVALLPLSVWPWAKSTPTT